MSQNKKISVPILHVINFLKFAREKFSLLKNEEIKRTKLKQLTLLEDWCRDYCKIYEKNGNFTKGELEHFLVMYQSCSTIYDLDFRQLIGGKEFHLEFNY